MRIGRCLPPAAALLTIRELFSGLRGILVGKSETERFRKELREYFGAPHSFLVSSGKTALTVILQALKEMAPHRDEVLIPAFTCFSVPSAIVRAGLKVRLCDVDSNSFDFDHEQLASIIENRKERLLCVVPVHLFGIPANLERVRDMIGDGGIFMVEDAAQAMGGVVDGGKLGTLCDVGLFSLGRGKALTTVEGGIILTKRNDIAGHIERIIGRLQEYGALGLLRLFFYALALSILPKPAFYWLPKSLPFLHLGETVYEPNFEMRRMSSFQAGLAYGWEKNLELMRRARSGNVRELLDRLDIELPWETSSALQNLLRFPLKVDSVRRKQAIVDMSEKNGLGIACSYPDSVDRIPELKPQIDSCCFPVASEVASRLVTLPVHPYLKIEDIDRISVMLSSIQ